MINKDLNLLIQPYLKSNIQLDDDTYINKDLDIYGSMATDLLENYSKLFNVDTSEFEFDKYFSSDIDNNTPLSIGDMERGMTLGFLNDDVITLEEESKNLSPKFSRQKVVIGIIFCTIFTIILCLVAYYL